MSAPEHLEPNVPRNQLKRRIAPGIWEDVEGNVHWSLTELLELVDLPDTPENREIVQAMLLDVMKKAGCQGKVIKRETPADSGRAL